VVFVGASMLDAAADPAAIAQVAGRGSSYNASLQGASLEMLAIWASDEVIGRLHPSTVVLGLSAIEYTPHDPQRIKATADFLASHPVRHLLGRESTVEALDTRVSSLSYLVRYRSVLRHPTQWSEGRDHRTGSVLDDPILSPDGHDLTFSSSYQYPEILGKVFSISQFRAGFRAGPILNFDVAYSKIQLVLAMIQHWQAVGIKVVVVNMPVTADFVSFLPHGRADYDKATAATAILAGETRATFVDGGIWATTYFADPIHLNGQGTQRFTHLIAPALARP
jgi:hypothetical protein